MSNSYTPEEIINRGNIIQSQTLLFDFLNAKSINKLINLFDTTSDNSITKIIEDERIKQGLNISNTKIITEVYGTNKNKTTLHLGIIKDNKDFIHLSIHLVPIFLNPEKSGIIHISKDVYIKSKKINNLNIHMLLLELKNQ